MTKVAGDLIQALEHCKGIQIMKGNIYKAVILKVCGQSVHNYWCTCKESGLPRLESLVLVCPE